MKSGERSNHIGMTCGQCIHFDECQEQWGQLAGKNEEACPDFEEVIRVLAVRQPWASLIVVGLKTIEVRTRNTNIRGPVAIYASRTTDANDFYAVREVLRKHRLPDMMPIGQVLGTVEITHSFPNIIEEIFNENEGEHLAPGEYFKENKTCFWMLENPVKFAEPVKLDKWPSGGSWARISKNLLPELRG